MIRYLLFLLVALVIVNAVYLYGRSGFLIDFAIYYMAGILLLGVILSFFNKKYGLSLIAISVLTYFVTGQKIITVQESVSLNNANSTITILEDYKKDKGRYPADKEFLELETPKCYTGYLPHKFYYTTFDGNFTLKYPVYNGYVKVYNSDSNKWQMED